MSYDKSGRMAHKQIEEKSMSRDRRGGDFMREGEGEFGRREQAQTPRPQAGGGSYETGPGGQGPVGGDPAQAYQTTRTGEEPKTPGVVPVGGEDAVVREEGQPSGTGPAADESGGETGQQ